MANDSAAATSAIEPAMEARTSTHTMSFIVPALNEEENIEATVKEILAAVDGRFRKFEILLIDDGSTDNTGKIMDDMARRIPQVRVIHNEKNMGFGAAYKRGVAAVSLDHLMLVPGDNAFPAESLAKILAAVGQADLVIPYRLNPEDRELGRRLLSGWYTTLLNILFWLKIKYYNGLVVHRTALLRQISIDTDGFAFQAEGVIKLLKRGHTYVEPGVQIVERKTGRTHALKFKNVASVLKTIARLFFEIHFKRQKPLPILVPEKAEKNS